MRDHEQNCKHGHSAEEHRAEREKLAQKQKDEICCLEHKIKKMQEDHAKEIHKLTCLNHSEHENEK